MAEHSPLPWSMELIGSPHRYRAADARDYEILSASGAPVGIVFGGFTGAEYDSVLLQRAVNSHDALLEACRAAIRICESRIHDDLDGTAGLDAALAELNPIRAAIAKAEGRAP